MKRAILVAALACAVAAPAAGVRAQDWGGTAGVAAMRGYTASAGVRPAGYAGASVPAPTDIAAIAPGPGPFVPARPVAGLTGDVPHRWRAMPARAGHRHGRRSSRRA